MKYRLPELSDRQEIELYIQEHYAHGETNLSATNMLTSMSFESWIKKVHDNVNKPDSIWGKSLTYLVLNDENKLIGFLNIRYDLPNALAEKYGHIGYGIRPAERRRGYASEALKYALDICKNKGMNKVLLGCYKENIGSAKTIMKNGGKLINQNNEVIDINGFYDINLIRQYYEIEL